MIEALRRTKSPAMTPADIGSACKLSTDADGIEIAEGDGSQELAGYLARNPGLSTVAADDHGNLIGAVLCGHDGRRGFVYRLAVAPATAAGALVARSCSARSTR